MSSFRLPAAPLIVAAILVLVALGGCSTVPLDDHQAALDEIDRLDDELEDARGTIADRDDRIAALREEVASLTDALERERADAAGIRGDLDVALRQLGTLREDRLDLRDELDDLETEIERLRSTAIASQRAAEAVDAAERASRPTERTPQDAFGAAADGGDGFSRVRSLGFQNDPRAAARLSAAAPGVGVDTDSGVPVLYDSRLDYDDTLAYLSIVDPEGRRPRLHITAQYVTDTDPLYLRTALITIEGGDPVDPVDPIVISGEPERETDGRRLLEALSVSADRGLIDRLSAMISSSRFRVTFVGMNDQHTYQPSVAERTAMSNMLFAFIDLGGVR
jgi:TolA-binding protein